MYGVTSRLADKLAVFPPYCDRRGAFFESFDDPDVRGFLLYGYDLRIRGRRLEFLL